MILVRFLLALKRLIYAVIITILRPIFAIFKFLLTKPLIKLYHLIFKLKKSSLVESPWHVLVRQRALHVLVFCLTLFIITSNVLNFSKDSANANASAQANQTIISHLVKNEFSAATDEGTLIEETSNLRQIMASGKEKYQNLKDAILNRPWISDVVDEESDLTYNDEALINNSPLNPGGSSDQDTNITNPDNTAPAAPPVSRSEAISYTVGNGDTISSIANKFRITINTILWSNNLTAFSLIRPGDKLTILPVSGTLYTVKSGDTVGRVALKFGVEENSIFQYNNIKSANGLVIGKSIIIPGGKKIDENSDVTVVKKTVVSQVSDAVAVIEKLVNPKQAPESNTRLLWPTEGHRITQYYSWRHTAVDIANKIGTPIYAAAAGTVVFAGWSTGYGNNTVIDHGNGMKTRYAHASKLFFNVGDHVERGEEIEAMGSTGWSTGPHVHFEVIINGVKYNPLNYIR